MHVFPLSSIAVKKCASTRSPCLYSVNISSPIIFFYNTSGIGTHSTSRVHWVILAMVFQLIIENFVDELSLQEKPGILYFEQPYFVYINRHRGLYIGGDIFVIVLPFLRCERLVIHCKYLITLTMQY